MNLESRISRMTSKRQQWRKVVQQRVRLKKKKKKIPQDQQEHFLHQTNFIHFFREKSEDG